MEKFYTYANPYSLELDKIVYGAGKSKEEALEETQRILAERKEDWRATPNKWLTDGNGHWLLPYEITKEAYHLIKVQKIRVLDERRYML